jgi:ssDNA-binding Zn-finger/Zn-ribbon topoisomerase 1
MKSTATICPRCRRGQLRRRVNRLTGDPYLMCENYPECSYVSDLDESEWDESADTPRFGMPTA